MLPTLAAALAAQQRLATATASGEFFSVVVSVEVECSLCLALPGLGLGLRLGLGLSVWGSSATARVVCWISRCDAGCEWVRAGLC